MLSVLIAWANYKIYSKLFIRRSGTPDDASPGKIENDDVPIVAQNGPIPVLFGDRIISGPNVVWYGDVYVKPIRKSISGGKK